LEKEQEPSDDENKFKWDNKNDKAHRLIGMSMSLDLRFHLQGFDGPYKYWEKFEVNKILFEPTR
jgi:hypothetical protein